MEMSLKEVLGVRVTCGTTEAQGFNPRIEICVPFPPIHLRTWASQLTTLVLIYSPVKWKEQMLYSPVSVELTLVKNVSTLPNFILCACKLLLLLHCVGLREG